ncbi:MAG: DNA polymerase III subunit gamma/tau [Gammaproteobacteria bacterium]|nr:DNA polymerase III subunit gamma/tau [Gammaproteobacteria bacterium]
MSYLVLARKWRPKDFADTVGQEHVLQALMNALETGRLHHAYLFTGTRGVGKTTIARILAKALNCETGVTAEPCGECSACQEIDEGRFVDLIEVDAASKTKVDDTRDMLDNVQYAPARGRYKVYLIDEVHMLSKSSFNALLKTLEEPPEHVKFLLATTDPQKLPVTVLSRCLQFNLKRMTPRLISDRLTYICDAENLEYEASALAMLARAADGSMRDALSLLDQAIAYCGGKVDETSTALMLGTIDRDHVMRLLRLLAGNDARGIIEAMQEIDEQFPDYGRLLEDLARDLQRIAVYQVVGASDSEEEMSEGEVAELAEAFDISDVQLFYQIAIMGRRDLHLAPDPRSGAEMTMLRMLAFRPAAAETTASSGGGGSAPVAKRARKAAPGQSAAATSAPEAAAAPAKTAKAEAESWQEPDWSQLVTQLGLNGAVRLLASNCAYHGRDGNTISLGLDPRSESMLTKQRRDAISERLSEYFGERLAVEITLGAEEAETPLQQESRMADEKLEEARQSLEADPNVQTLKTMFGAELKTDTIEIIPGDKG